MNKSDIDITFNFTTDSPLYWDSYRDNLDTFGISNIDPDTASPTLRRYQQRL